MLMRLLLCILLLLPWKVRCQSLPIGQWRAHLPWRHSAGLAASPSSVYCQTPQGVFTVTFSDNAISRYTKVNGLHDANITAMGLHEGSGALVIAYANGNIDLLRDELVTNIPDFKLSAVTGDKRTRHIAFAGRYAYLCTGAGIVAVDLEKQEIADSYRIGPVMALEQDERYFYAATPAGIRRAPKQGLNLADPASWETIPAWGAATQLASLNGQLLALQADTLYLLTPAGRQRWFANGAPIRSAAASSGSLFVCQPGRVLQLSPAGATVASFAAATPNAALTAAGGTWVADGESGLLRFNGASLVNYTPNGPRGVVKGEMTVHNGVLWTASGAVTANWQGVGNTDGLSRFDNDEWDNLPLTPPLRDMIPLSAAGNELFAGSFGGGLLAVGSNTIVKPGGDSLVSGLATDRDGRLWVSTYGAAFNLHVRKTSATWQDFSIPIFHTANAVSQIVIDDADQKWIVSPRNNGVFVFNHGANVEVTADDRWKRYQPGAGQGNLPSPDVRCITKDNDGYIWIGTAKGVAVVQCPGTFCDAYWPVLREDNFAGYLFQNEVVNTIATDGANRKWVGTLNGAWLISPGGEKILEHFDAANSPLPSDSVLRVAIHPVSGEVFFATAAGLVSWRGTATAGSPTQGSEVLVFPNPVPHAYEGTIAIRGLVQNAVVKITDTAGRLVFQTRANGGQAVWNGRDYTGHRPQSGVYLIFASDDTGKEKIVTKLVFIH